MNNKKKWASILTIATSLVLCIISTFGITLAFFGGNASANLSTITLKTGIEIGAAIESSVGSAKVVPGQPVKITATGTVSATELGSADANNAVDGVVRAKFNVGNELGEVTIDGNNTDFWTDGNDGYYYLVTAENGTTLRTVSKGTSVQIFGDLIVSKNFTNADSGKSVEASVIFEVIQADIYKADGTKIDLTVANATSATSNALKDAFDTVRYGERKIEIIAKELTFVHFEEDPFEPLNIKFSDGSNYTFYGNETESIIRYGTSVTFSALFDNADEMTFKNSIYPIYDGTFFTITNENDEELARFSLRYNKGVNEIDGGAITINISKDTKLYISTQISTDP